MNHSLKNSLIILRDNIYHWIYVSVSWIKDKSYCYLQYKLVNGGKLNLKNPQTYNDKIQWIKLFDHNPIYHVLVDKIEVRKYVEERIGRDYLIPIVGGPWTDVFDINIDDLPDKFVLKTTHDSGGVVICKDKQDFDLQFAKRFLNNRMKHDYFLHGREWAYKGITPRVYAEKYMVDESGYELKDYKVFCFDGKPVIIQVDFGRYTKHERNLYNTDWEYIPAQIKYPTNPHHLIEKPSCLDKLLDVSEKLSDGLPHARVDLFVIYDKVYFGEITLYHGSGCERFSPKEYGLELGSYLSIPSDNTKDFKG